MKLILPSIIAAFPVINLMPCWIVIPDRVIIHKPISIPRLRPLRPGRDDTVGREETSQRGVHPARVEEVDSEAGFFALTGKFVVRAQVAESIPRLTEGFIERGGGLGSVRVRGDGGTAEVLSNKGNLHYRCGNVSPNHAKQPES